MAPTRVDAKQGPKPGSDLEARVSRIGAELQQELRALLAELPDDPQGPVALGRVLGLDKVLASRLLKALRGRDPVAAVHDAPGPDPLRRVIKAARKVGVARPRLDAADAAVDAFDRLIREEVGDRSALNAIVSAWLPGARVEFETRRKQAAFRAMSELRGASTDTTLALVVLHPSSEPDLLDVVWVTGVFGLRRLRPGAPVKFATRRIAKDAAPRRPTNLDGQTVDGLADLWLDDFCSKPIPPLDVHAAGDVVHYTLGDHGFGPRSAVDLVFAEVNRAEMDASVPAGSGRKGYVFAEIATPSRRLLFDVLVHRDVYPASEPTLHVYDTAFEGVASVNDRGRDIDRLDLVESVQPLGYGLSQLRAAELPASTELLSHVVGAVGWNGDDLRAYRTRVEYPIYGSQVALAFDPPER